MISKHTHILDNIKYTIINHTLNDSADWVRAAPLPSLVSPLEYDFWLIDLYKKNILILLKIIWKLKMILNILRQKFIEIV